MGLLTLDVTGMATLRGYVQALSQPLPPEAHAQAGAVVQTVWQQAATGLVLPPMTQPINTPKLAEAVQMQVSAEGVTVSAPDDLMPHDRPAWDMKPGLVHGPHARMGKQGRYNRIPFHHDAKTLPSHIVQSLIAGQSITSLEGIRSKILNGGHPVLAYQPGSGTFAVVSHYTWQTGLYTGMRLGMHPHYGVGPVTFRTVSERSPAASWWYPAKPGTPWAGPVWEAVEEAVVAAWVAAWEVQVFGAPRGGGGPPDGD
jgi:hypothetical protein